MNITPEIWYGIGAAALLAGMIYGAIRYATRDKRKDPATERATRNLYNTQTRDDFVEPPAPDEPSERREGRRSDLRG
jgi:hypothetical protein